MRPYEIQGVNRVKSIGRRLMRAGCILAFMGIPLMADAQHAYSLSPLHVFTSQAIVDEFGEPLEGHGSWPAEASALVQILPAPGGVVHPPLTEPYGVPHPENSPPLAETRIGNLVSPSMSQPSRFAYSLNGETIKTGQMFFVRVFSAPDPTGEVAAFYGDSQVMTAQNDPRIVYDVQIGKTDQPVDRWRDTDGDGLPDWWKHLHLRDALAEVDPHGYRPGHRVTLMQDYIAGTDPNDPYDYFMISLIEPLLGDTYTEYVWEDDDPESEYFGHIYTQRLYDVEGALLFWPSVEGRVYTIEYTTNLFGGVFGKVPDAADLPATPPVNVFEDGYVPNVFGPVYYRAVVRYPGPEAE